ncbi:MAG TPA: sigma-54-dependent Fis family transcriptional regulator [Caldithrix abyssi]|uniref:Sigma-54-dependent Fis family transcriptional regulator n=1 Tax=Caldithrix abyssi TaxID=187145 RepID=A0A7V4U0H8_CALAY|nr:sigma-54-dependent Fis family transcriptional regulator [Caldithrix abyssi]
MHRILVVDDDPTVLKGILFSLEEKKPYDVATASSKEEALQLLTTNEFDLVVSDLMVPTIEEGLEIIKTARQQWYTPSILAMTAYESIENAVRTMQAGANDFITKGFGVDELIFRIENILKQKSQIDQLANENRILKETIQQHFSNFNIVGESQHIRDLLKRIRKVASDATVTCLLQGESGTGKDLVARTIHATSRRKNAPFVPINCAAIPENLIESELFGHERGAFTGAVSTKIGKFEQAKGGVVFLDEIGELPYPLQVRLLRILEERSFYRVGGKRSIEVDVMIVAATNKDLNEMVRLGTFRADLYFRLNVSTIHIEPLRNRKEDIRPLAVFFLNRFNNERKRELKFTEEALQLLEKYDFPGNVRELRNIIEDAFVFCEGPWIKPENLNLKMAEEKNEDFFSSQTVNTSSANIFRLKHKEAVARFEREYFLKLLNDSYWKKSEVAKRSGISREWLNKKLNQLNIRKKE